MRWYHVAGAVAGGSLALVLARRVLAKPPTPPPPVCEEIMTEGECLAAGCYWWDDACHSTPPPKPPETIDDLTWEWEVYHLKAGGADVWLNRWRTTALADILDPLSIDHHEFDPYELYPGAKQYEALPWPIRIGTGVGRQWMLDGGTGLRIPNWTRGEPRPKLYWHTDVAGGPVCYEGDFADGCLWHPMQYSRLFETAGAPGGAIEVLVSNPAVFQQLYRRRLYGEGGYWYWCWVASITSVGGRTEGAFRVEIPFFMGDDISYAETDPGRWRTGWGFPFEGEMVSLDRYIDYENKTVWAIFDLDGTFYEYIPEGWRNQGYVIMGVPVWKEYAPPAGDLPLLQSSCSM